VSRVGEDRADVVKADSDEKRLIEEKEHLRQELQTLEEASREADEAVESFRIPRLLMEEEYVDLRADHLPDLLKESHGHHVIRYSAIFGNFFGNNLGHLFLSLPFCHSLVRLLSTFCVFPSMHCSQQ